MEPHAAGAHDATLAVEQHAGHQVDGLGELPLFQIKSGGPLARAHRLILQRAFATLIADGAIERVVNQEKLHDSLLCLACHVGGVLSFHHHALGGLQRAGSLGFGESAAVAGIGDIDHALAAGCDGLETGVVAETGDIDAQLLRGADDNRALGDGDLLAVDF